MAKDTGFVVSWVPLDEVKRACTKLGQRDGDGTSFWDWIEPEHCERTKGFDEFEPALRFAKTVAQLDAFSEARIERLRLTEDDDDGTSWEADARWDVREDTGPHREDAPDVLLEAA